MARIKTKYRRFRDGGAVTVDAPLTVDVLVPDEAAAAAVNGDPAPERDDASIAFQKQIDDLRAAEELQRQRAAQAAEAPRQLHQMTRNERAEHWRSQGIPDDDAAYMHLMVEHPAATAEAVERARLQGLDEDSREFHHAVRDYFHERMNPATSRLERPEVEEMERGAPKPRQRMELDLPEPNRRGVVSAPVSRDPINYSGSHEGRPSNSRITLSAEEKDMARRSGISEVEYAANKLRMEEEKRSGMRQ